MNFQATSCCRICLKSELLMSIYLYSPTFPMRPIEIVEKLNIFKYDETLPTLLCQSCLYRLLDAYNLQQLAEASERRLRDYIGNGGGLGLCGIGTNSINQDSSSFSSTAAMGDSCKQAGITAAIYSNICDIFERNNIPASNVGIGEHECMVTGEDMLNDIEIDVSSLTRSEANDDTLNDVLANKHGNFVFNQGVAMEAKSLALETKISPVTKDDKDLIAKMFEKCTTCAKVFKNTGYLEAHKRTHIGEKRFQCKQCPRQFKQSSNLLLHQRTHTGERRFQCEICASFFTTSSNLKAHKATHLERREHRCSQCERDFKTLRELRRHEPVHKTVKDNVCEKCQKAFTKRTYLMDHIAAMHRGVRRHKCAECGKLFGRRSNLVSHIRIHSGEKPFQCKYCTWKFNQSSALARHMKKHLKSKNVDNNYKTAEQTLKNASLNNILQIPKIVETAPADASTVANIPLLTGFNALSNISTLGDMHCMTPECLNVATDVSANGGVDALQSNSNYDFAKNGILDFSTNQQVC